MVYVSAQWYVYAQDPTNLFRPHKSFIRKKGQTEKQAEIVCRKKNISKKISKKMEFCSFNLKLLLGSLTHWWHLTASGEFDTLRLTPKHRRSNISTLRVAKCQGYWGYIRVKMFAGWGKKFGRTCNFAKSSLFGKIYASFSSFPCTN